MATTTLNPSEISELIKNRIEKVKLAAEARNEGTITSVSDGIVRIYGLADAMHAIILRALKVWREVANGRRVAGAQEVSWLMLKELGGQGAEGELASLVKSIHLDALRENARGHALAIAAA